MGVELLNDHVIVSDFDTAIQYDNIYLRLKQLASMCFDMQYSRHSSCGAHCRAFLVFYCLETPINLEWINQHPNSLVSFLKVLLYPTFGEIYDVCTDTSEVYRRKGYMKKIFTSIQEDLPKHGIERLWLGIDPLNPFFEAAVRLYASVGFQQPKLTTKTMSTQKIIVNAKPDHERPFYIQMIWINGNISEYKYADIAILLRNNLSQTYNLEIMKFKKQELDFIHHYMDSQELEMGGYFVPVQINLHNQKTSILGMFDIPSYAFGIDCVYSIYWNPSPILTEEKTQCRELNQQYLKYGFNPITGCEGSVDIPDARLNFHSHPFIFKTEKNLFGRKFHYLWPSATDMKYVLWKYYVGNRAHFVFASEGIYVLQLHPAFAAFWMSVNTNSKIFTMITDLITETFIHWEPQRESIDTPEEQLYMKAFSNFLRFSNQCTVNYLVETVYRYQTEEYRNKIVQELMDKSDVLTPDIPIFYVQFIDRDKYENINIELFRASS